MKHRAARRHCVGLTLCGALLSAACTQSLRLTPDDSRTVLTHTSIAAPNPGDRGPYSVRTLYYGSGTDRQRRVFRDSVTLRTPAVDASRFATVVKDKESWHRRFWGFDMKKVPLNGRVWYPEGAGPFPLVLIVHGNHDPADFSDPGYAWLGEHLASRGFILASIDENFFNALMQENDARAWLLLKHLERWRAWNDSVAGPFNGKVDLSNIALIGHSRGGESVAHAATFNRIARYPDDARTRFNFGFNIKSIVALAPVDAQYRPAGQLMPVENVNYLIIHGSHDGDVASFIGRRQYQRVRFTDQKSWFKSTFYVYRANHGQFNTVWGNADRGPFRSSRQLDVRGLISGEEQRQLGRVLIGAFLEATLHNKREYVALFHDHRTAGTWLPRTMYITRYDESGSRYVADFEEDVDPSTGTVHGVRINGDSLSAWREMTIRMRLPTWVTTETTNNNVVMLGWNRRIAGKDTTQLGQPATFTIQLPDSLGRGREKGSLIISAAPTRDVPRPRGAAATARPPKPASDANDPMDFTIELEDAKGRTSRQLLSRYGPVRRPLEVRIHRRKDRDKLTFATTFDLVMQTYVIRIADFATAGFDATRLKTIRLVFDRTPAGTVVIDDVGFIDN